MAWIAITDALPMLREKVYVRGAFTPKGYGNPKAWLWDYKTKNNIQIEWHSSEWRGTAGITHWWLEESETNKAA